MGCGSRLKSTQRSSWAMSYCLTAIYIWKPETLSQNQQWNVLYCCLPFRCFSMICSCQLQLFFGAMAFHSPVVCQNLGWATSFCLKTWSIHRGHFYWQSLRELRKCLQCYVENSVPQRLLAGFEGSHHFCHTPVVAYSSTMNTKFFRKLSTAKNMVHFPVKHMDR